MSRIHSWQAIRAEVMRRIAEREWKPGDQVPHETRLAEEFGCARATVNRAMREVARAGLIERRRKAGTRVAVNPVRRATIEIPVIRMEVESLGMCWTYRLLERAPRHGESEGRIRVCAVHLADGRPYVRESRWIDTRTVPSAADADFRSISANEWLLRNAAYTHGEIELFAAGADRQEADALSVQSGAPVFVVERATWHGVDPVTRVRLTYAPGYRIGTVL